MKSLLIKQGLIVILSLVYSLHGYAQDKNYALQIIDTLCSKTMWGRGYTRDGLNKAANFIASEFKRHHILPLQDDSYFQDFTYPVNTFPGEMNVQVNGQTLLPGIDYLVGASSLPIFSSNIEMKQADSMVYINAPARFLIERSPKLVWTVSPVQEEFAYIQIVDSLLKTFDHPLKIDVMIETEFIDSFRAKNICGIVKGTHYPDSFLVITAHYDHLGGMGNNTHFPGANDNASGTALMMDLAKYYALHPLPYSVVFIAFSGEEIGLLGSDYFVTHPLIPLANIRFLMNLDLMGNGVDGITVVNATVFNEDFNLLKNVNIDLGLQLKIHERGKAKNSDHYYFSEKGVPSFFIYTQGGVPFYHDVYDQSSTLPMTIYDEMFQLVNGLLLNISRQ